MICMYKHSLESLTYVSRACKAGSTHTQQKRLNPLTPDAFLKM